MTALAAAPPRRRSQGPRVVRFIERCCIHVDGELIRQPIEVHPFWRDRIKELFEVLPRSCPHCGELEAFDAEGEGWRCRVCAGALDQLPPDERRYSEAMIVTPKKNAKTLMMAGLGLYGLVGERDPSALVVCAAASEDQSANLLYGAAKFMAEHSPPLMAMLQPFRQEILVKDQPRARMRNVTSTAGTNDGANISLALCDELHEWKGQRGRDMHTVLTKGTATRRNALILNITTPGSDEDAIWFDRYTYGRAVRAGEIDDPRFYYYESSAPEGCDHRDPAMWAIANPLYEVSVRKQYLEDEVRRNPEGPFRRYNLAQHTTADDVWLEYGKWDACYAPELCAPGVDWSGRERPILQFDPALPLFVGLDIAKTIDSSALAMVQVRVAVDEETGERRRRYLSRVHIWENPFAERDPRHHLWTMNNHVVKQECRELFQSYPTPAAIAEVGGAAAPGPAFVFDPWRFRTEADDLAGEGLNMQEVPQTDTHMVPASQGLYESIINLEIAHDGDPILKRHIEAVSADPRERGWRMRKPAGSRRKIDGAVALALARLAAETEPPVIPRVGIMWA